MQIEPSITLMTWKEVNLSFLNWRNSTRHIQERERQKSFLRHEFKNTKFIFKDSKIFKMRPRKILENGT
jgi:hypothetical protein